MFQSERLELSDGDFIDLAWVGKGEGPIVCILHGLCGNLQSPYAHRILQFIQNQGWRALFIHFRGCSGEPNRLPRSYHSGETEDLAYIVAEIKKREPHTPLFGIGYSLGGNVLLKWLGETNSHNPFVAAVAISVPFDLQQSTQYLNTGLRKIYQWRLVRELKSTYIKKFKKIQSPLAIENYNAIKTFIEFDDAITAPLHGFKNADDYYQRSSSRSYLKDIAIPTLIIHAKDDPFTPMGAIPKRHELSDKITLEMTEKGGHVGFVEGHYPWQKGNWLERKILSFLDEHLNKLSL